MSDFQANEKIAAMEVEIACLNKTVQALMDRAERSMSQQGSDFSHFQATIVLEEQVKRRTQDLEAALRENEKVNRILQGTKDALEHTEERYRAATDAATDAFITIDESNVITFVNPAAERIFGYPPEEMVGRDLMSLLPSHTPSIDLLTALDRQPHQERGVELNCLHRDGHPIPMEFTFGAFLQGGKSCYTIIARDVSRRVKALTDLRESQERFKLFCSATNDVIWDIDLASNAMWLSPAHEKLYGEARDNFAEGFVEWQERIHPNDREGVIELFNRSIEDRVASWNHEFRYRRNDGTHADILNRVFVLFDADGAPARIVGAMTDITERKRTEEAQRAKDQAEKSNQAKSAFLSRMSHELRTPLNAILGFAQLQEIYDASEQQRDCTVQILKGGRHLLGLINEILDISRIESGNMSISLEPVLVQDVVGEVLSLVGPVAAEHNVSVSVDPESVNGIYAMADRQRLLQILINLVSNGIKYNVSGGTVEVRCSVDETQNLAISVRDTGMGIGEDMADRVFMPFDRLGIEQRSDIDGTGLGLALSKTLAEAMDGSIDFKSKRGEGTVFSLRLRKTTEPQIVDIDINAEYAAFNRKRARWILYIEDNESNLRLMQHLITSVPAWQLDTAMTGCDGLRRMSELKPDLLLLDLDLPDLSGADVFARMRANPATADIPVLIVSADATRDRVEKLLAAGADGYITKPYEVGDLFERMATLMNCGESCAA